MVKYTQRIHRLLPRNCLSVFDHFVELALKGLRFLFNNCLVWKPVVLTCCSTFFESRAQNCVNQKLKHDIRDKTKKDRSHRKILVRRNVQYLLQQKRWH